MSRMFNRWLLALAAAALFAAAPAMAAQRLLVDVGWLQQNLGRDDVLVIDASPGHLHARGHIPGAVNADVFTYGGSDNPPAAMERRFQSWGLGAGKKVVLYDPGGTYFATSLLFDLHYHGFPLEDVAILDGGLAKWSAAGGAVTKDPTPAPKPGTFRVAQLNEGSRVRLPEFLVASGEPAGNALVEALEPEQHFGAAKFFNTAGHVPNAIMTPSGDYFNADKTFKSPEEIRRMLAYLGATPDKQVLTHCGGGIAASVPFFAMKFMLDYPRVKLYKESQLEWLRDDRGLPFWTYDAPNLARDKAWVNGWNGQMLRTFGVSKLSIVDVRPAAAFQQSHVPFAINVPAEVFRQNLHSPARLAEALGAAGVNAAHEAVVVSEGGVNADSALAFLMLEKLGQKRVSVLADSVDDWAFAGLPVAKEGAPVDPKKPPAPPAKPMAYPDSVRPGIVATGGNGGAGLYPRIYLASGKALPAKAPEGKVIHVPYTDLLDAGGKPKAAKDIWTVLVKAGVPRFAEIVSIADEPGEAAATYFILKMMGFPDVKVAL